jgi:hypothetical protein
LGHGPESSSLGNEEVVFVCRGDELQSAGSSSRKMTSIMLMILNKYYAMLLPHVMLMLERYIWHFFNYILYFC